MKLASLKNGRDGTLVVVSKDLTRAFAVGDRYPTMQSALDDWKNAALWLTALSFRLRSDEPAPGEFAFDPRQCASPLPRAYQWADGSAYVNHVELVRRARGAEMPESFRHDPLMYQGGSDFFLGPTDDIVVADEKWGADFEGEIAVILKDAPAGIPAEKAEEKIALLMLANDVSLRNLVPAELAKGFGFFQSKPPSAFSPVAVTPEELEEEWRNAPAALVSGESRHVWKDSRVRLPLRVDLNGQPFGRADAGVDMVFNFARLIAHAAKTRPLKAGTIVGSGTVSNKDSSVGSSCVAEKRMLETIADGEAKTPFLRDGDVVRIEMLDENGRSIFGAIEQRVRVGAQGQGEQGEQ